MSETYPYVALFSACYFFNYSCSNFSNSFCCFLYSASCLRFSMRYAIICLNNVYLKLIFCPIGVSDLYFAIKKAIKSKMQGIRIKRMKSQRKAFPATDIPPESSSSTSSSGSIGAVTTSSTVF